MRREQSRVVLENLLDCMAAGYSLLQVPMVESGMLVTEIEKEAGFSRGVSVAVNHVAALPERRQLSILDDMRHQYLDFVIHADELHLLYKGFRQLITTENQPAVMYQLASESLIFTRPPESN